MVSWGAMQPLNYQRHATALRLGGLLVFGLSAYLCVYVLRQDASGPFNQYWNAVAQLAAFGTIGVLTLAAVDRIAGVRPHLAPGVVIALAAAGIVAMSGYEVHLSGLTDSRPDWMLPFGMVTNGVFSWLLLVLALVLLTENTRTIAFAIGGAILVSAIAEGFYGAENAFMYPLSTFIQNTGFSFVVGLIVIAAGARDFHQRLAIAGGSLAIAFAALGFILLAHVVWQSQLAETLVLPDEIALRSAATTLGLILVGLVFAGVLPLRAVLIVAAIVALAGLGASMAMLNLISENQVLFFVSSLVYPVGLALFAVALAIAFESNRGEERAIVEPEEEGDFGPPLEAWR